MSRGKCALYRATWLLLCLPALWLTGKAAEKGAEATADGAKKVGTGVKDAVTGEKK